MTELSTEHLNYARPVQIAKGVYWVGAYDNASGLRCNPYLVIDGEEAVVIDGGSRLDFPETMMKILQTGILPASVLALIYHHYDPDVCGSMPDYEQVIAEKDLEIISDKHNIMFMRHYRLSSHITALEPIHHQFKFSSGRTLQFINIPYVHSAGSFVTFDAKTGILFSSDLFGSFGKDGDLFLNLNAACKACRDLKNCSLNKPHCPLMSILSYHQIIISSERALKSALEQIVNIPFSMIAPHHGRIICQMEDIYTVFYHLVHLKNIGIERILDQKTSSPPSHALELLKKRLNL